MFSVNRVPGFLAFSDPVHVVAADAPSLSSVERLILDLTTPLTFIADIYSWNSTGEIGRHRAETHRYFNIRFFGQMSPDASDFPGGIPAKNYRCVQNARHLARSMDYNVYIYIHGVCM